MVVSSIPAPRPTALARYGFALLTSLLALLLSWLLVPITSQAPFLFFYAAVVASALYGGWQPMALVTVIGALAIGYFFIPPAFSLAISLAGLLELGVFTLVAVVTGLLAERRGHSERSAREQGEQFRVTLASIGDAVIVTDSAGEIVFMNAVAQALTGWAESEALGKPSSTVFRIVNATTRAVVESPVTRVLREGRTVGLANHTLLVARDGTERPIDDSGAPVRGADGMLRGVVLVFRDVTERQRADAAVRAARDQLDVILHGVADGITAHDANGRLIYANDSAAQVSGFPSAEAMLATPPNAILNRFDLLDEAGQPFPVAQLPGRQALGGAIKPEALIRFRNQATGEERWSLVKATAVRDPVGQGTLAINILHDVTARRQAELALRSSEERLQTALQAAQMVAWEWTLATGALVYSDRALSLLGLAPDQQLASVAAVLAAVHPADRPPLADLIAAASTARGAYHTEVRWIRPDTGAVTWLELHARVSTDSADLPIRIIGVVADITERKRAEAERIELLEAAQVASTDAAAARAQLEALLERITDAVFAVDRDWHYTYVNTQATRLTRKTRQELLGQQMWAVFPDVVGGLSYRELQRAMQEQVPVAFENSNARLQVWGETRAYPSAEGLTIFTRDITAQKQIEQVAQRAAEYTARLQSVTAALVGALTPAAIASVVLREGLAAVAADAGSIALLRPNGDELEILHAVGYPAEVVAQYRRIAVRAASPEADTVRSAAPIWLESRAAAVARWPDLAAVHPVIPWHAWANLPLLVDGQAIGNLSLGFIAEQAFDAEVRGFLLTLAQQCSQALERARLYEAERQARARAELIQRRVSFLADVTTRLTASLDYPTRLNQLARLVIPTLADFCVVYVQQADGWITRMALAHGDPAQEAQLQALQTQDRIDPNGPNPIAQVFRSGEAEIITRLSAADLPPLGHNPIQETTADQPQPHAYLLFPLAARGQIIGAMSFMLTNPARAYTDEDLTLAGEVAHRAALALDNARLYRDAKDAIQVRDQFLSVAAHELKTPLTSLLGNAQLLQRRDQRDNLLGPRERRNVQIIVNQASRLSAMVLTLLDASRLEAGQLSIQSEQLDLGALIRRIVEEAGPSLEGRAFDLRAPDTVLLVNGDALRLEQVVQNLIQNAVKYSAPPTPITIEVVPQVATVAIMVHDQGIGIPAEAIPRLFQRFFRASNVNTTNVVGMGIGLYVVREIVTLHGGTVEVVSSEGVGSTFTVTLPLAQPPSAT